MNKLKYNSRINNRKFRWLSLVLSVVAVFIFFIFFWSNPSEKAKADVGGNLAVNPNVYGWAWNDSVGWITMNHLNCDVNNNTFIDTKCGGNDDASTPIIHYGVNLATTTGEITGYAWSEVLGWIKFDPVDTPPGNPAYTTRINIGTGEVSGWARICSKTGDPINCSNAFNGLGWISFSSRNCDVDGDGYSDGDSGCPAGGIAIPTYGVNLDQANRFEGFAYNGDGDTNPVDGIDDGISWISFSSLNCDSDKDGLSEGTVGCPAAETPMGFYGVGAAINNVHGWAWSANFGWISMNCVDIFGFCIGGSNPGIPCPIGNECLGGGTCDQKNNCGGGFYGVDIDDDNLTFTGHGWSSNSGWISFMENNVPGDDYTFNDALHGNCPACTSANNCTACFNESNGSIYGWAKILALGDDGWIRLDDDNTGDSYNYGLSIDGATGDFLGWAWNSDNNGQGVGWISFNCINEGVCATSDYKVSASLFLNNPPYFGVFASPDLTAEQACEFGVRGAFLRWTFQDDDAGDTQAGYQITLDDDDDPSSLLLDTGYCAGAALSSGPNCIVDGSAAQFNIPDPNLGLTLNYGTTYYWWIKVWDNHGAESATSSRQTFSILAHERPDVDFEWFPASPSVDEETLFDSIGSEPPPPPTGEVFSRFYTSGSPNTPVNCDDANCQYLWTITLPASGGGTITDDSAASTTIIFDQTGAKRVKLRVTDNDLYWCEAEKEITAKKRLPTWIETK